jgi:ABC-type antimicrobial peptide transport system permease subunit
MASIALLMAIAGVSGVLSFAVSRRTREFGIRMVLGANRKAVFGAVMLRGIRQIAIGLICGIALAEPGLWGLTRLLKRSNLPFHSFDPLVYGIAALLLVAVSLAAMYLPALRATQVDPIRTLRSD